MKLSTNLWTIPTPDQTNSNWRSTIQDLGRQLQHRHGDFATPPTLQNIILLSPTPLFSSSFWEQVNCWHTFTRQSNFNHASKGIKMQWFKQTDEHKQTKRQTKRLGNPQTLWLCTMLKIQNYFRWSNIRMQDTTKLNVDNTALITLKKERCHQTIQETPPHPSVKIWILSLILSWWQSSTQYRDLKLWILHQRQPLF